MRFVLGGLCLFKMSAGCLCSCLVVCVCLCAGLFV